MKKHGAGVRGASVRGAGAECGVRKTRGAERASRRSFIRVAGAALSVPLAAAAVHVPAEASEDLDPAARLARLEDVEAIRALIGEFARHVNAGNAAALAALHVEPAGPAIDPDVRHLAPDGFGESDAITVAPDGLTATARLSCAVQRETAIGPDCPLLEMARAQGGGVVRRTDHAVAGFACARRDGVWRIARVDWSAGAAEA